MAVLTSQARPGSDEFKANQAAHAALLADVAEAAALAAAGGGAGPQERHAARGKMLPRDRVAGLLDAGSPFLEIGATAAHGMYEGAAPGAGLIAGVGRVHGRWVMLVCNDATVKGGTYFPDNGKKTPSRARGCAGKSSALRLSGRLRRGQPAAAGSGLPGPRPFRAHLLQSGTDVRRRDCSDRSRHGVVHRRGRLCARDVGRVDHCEGSGHDFPGRTAAGEGRNRRGRQCRRPWWRRRPHPLVRRCGLPGPG